MSKLPRKTNFILCITMMLIFLFMVTVSFIYDWPAICTAFFTFLVIACLVFAAYIYVSASRQGILESMRAEKEDTEKQIAARTEYYSNMAHEIRTPINAIMGYNELILREYNDPALRQYAGNIRSAANSLLAIVNDSLDYSRIEAGKMKIFCAEYDLAVLIDDLVDMATPLARKKGLELKCNVNGQIPGTLYGDSERLGQCVTNLLTNAVKYTEEGEIVLTFDYEYTDGPEGEDRSDILLKVSVRDTGIGIRQEDIEKLYKPFERIDEERNKSVEGSGLGMAIVMHILELMGSELKVESIYGEGSLFGFEVRQKVIRTDPIGDFANIHERNLEGRHIYRNTFTAPDARVLVADAAELNLNVMEELLKDTGVKVDCAMSFRTAVEMAESNDYDLIFADLKLPDDGAAKILAGIREDAGNKRKKHVFRRIKRALIDDGEDEVTLRNQSTPFIALTSGNADSIQKDPLSPEYDDFLLKPIIYKELEDMMLKYLPAEKIIKSGAKRENEPLLMTDEKLREALEILKSRSEQ